MPRVPTNVSEMLNFCIAHAKTWSTISPTSVGLTAADVTKLDDLCTDTTAALEAQGIAKTAAKAATLTANNRVKDLRKMIASMIRTIVNFAEDAADPDAVFAAAQIDPTSPRTPSVPPGQPTDMTATLDASGNLTLRWTCVNPPGGSVVYSVTRRDTPTGSFAQVGLVGARSFTDTSIPAGATGGVTYQIRGVRGTLLGPESLRFTLQFGHASGGGGMFTASTEKAPFRVAA